MHGAGSSTAGYHGQAAPAAAAGAHDHVADAKKKKSFGERFYDWSVKAGVPVNKITNKLGSEAFWPTSMDKECDKAARILKSFCSKLHPLIFILYVDLFPLLTHNDRRRILHRVYLTPISFPRQCNEPWPSP
jgi:hypothetical protein